jgi:hypothetical protein
VRKAKISADVVRWPPQLAFLALCRCDLPPCDQAAMMRGLDFADIFGVLLRAFELQKPKVGVLDFSQPPSTQMGSLITVEPASLKGRTPPSPTAAIREDNPPLKPSTFANPHANPQPANPRSTTVVGSALPLASPTKHSYARVAHQEMYYTPKVANEAKKEKHRGKKYVPLNRLYTTKPRYKSNTNAHRSPVRAPTKIAPVVIAPVVNPLPSGPSAEGPSVRRLDHRVTSSTCKSQRSIQFLPHRLGWVGGISTGAPSAQGLTVAAEGRAAGTAGGGMSRGGGRGRPGQAVRGCNACASRNTREATALRFPCRKPRRTHNATTKQPPAPRCGLEKAQPPGVHPTPRHTPHSTPCSTPHCILHTALPPAELPRIIHALPRTTTHYHALPRTTKNPSTTQLSRIPR